MKALARATALERAGPGSQLPRLRQVPLGQLEEVGEAVRCLLAAEAAERGHLVGAPGEADVADPVVVEHPERRARLVAPARVLTAAAARPSPDLLHAEAHVRPALGEGRRRDVQPPCAREVAVEVLEEPSEQLRRALAGERLVVQHADAVVTLRQLQPPDPVVVQDVERRGTAQRRRGGAIGRRTRVRLRRAGDRERHQRQTERPCRFPHELGLAAVRAGAGVAALDLLRELLELLGERRAEALEVGLLAVLAQPQLGRQLVRVEQVLVGTLRGLDRLDLERAVVPEAGRRRDQLADDHVLLEADKPIALALEGGVGQDLGGLLERGRREERLRRERGLGDPQDPLLALGRRAAVLLGLLVDLLELVPVLERAGQERGGALRLDLDLLHHLTHDQLDVLVVDVDALRLVDPLDLADDVLLGLGPATDLEDLCRIERALVELRPGLDPSAVLDVEARARRQLVVELLALRVRDRDHDRLVALLDRNAALDRGDLRQPLRLARLEQLDHAGQALRDVEAGDAAGVERAHRQLRARLADRLRGDDADRVAQLDHRAGRERPAVALAANAGLELALERGPDGHRGVLLLAVRLDDLGQLLLVDLVVALQELAAALGRELLRGDPADQVRVGRAVLEQHRHLDVLLGLAVVGTDDHVLRDVDQTAGQIARVGRAKRRVGEALTGAVGGDEVLEHRQALHEVGLDRALDDLALRIRHQPAHPRQLADLLERAASARVGHHEDGVELVEVLLHRRRDLVGRVVPEVGDVLLALLGRDVAVLVLLEDLARLALVLLEDLVLGRRRDHVVLRDRDPGLGRVVEAELLERVQGLRDRAGAVLLDEVGDDLVDVLLDQRAVDEDVLLRIPLVLERLGERALDPVVEDDPADRGQEVLMAVAPVLGEVV